ncbi:hypothetical protein LSAT2_020910 [Lamellibrachia satsuma]|nr:hypothetical protein LSAT2_020910 [Lamellibrachia satsuma]
MIQRHLTGPARESSSVGEWTNQEGVNRRNAMPSRLAGNRQQIETVRLSRGSGYGRLSRLSRGSGHGRFSRLSRGSTNKRFLAETKRSNLRRYELLASDSIAVCRKPLIVSWSVLGGRECQPVAYDRRQRRLVSMTLSPLLPEAQPVFARRLSPPLIWQGTSGIDIDLQKVDINQCPLPPGSTELNVFKDSHKCKTETTKCVPVAGLGFRRGSYKCECRDAFYFPPNASNAHGRGYYNGSRIEAEYERKVRVGGASASVLPSRKVCSSSYNRTFNIRTALTLSLAVANSANATCDVALGAMFEEL